MTEPRIDAATKQEWAERCFAVEAQRDAQASRIDTLEKALRWYADNAAKCRLLHREGDAGRQALNDDGGFKARAALGGGE